MQTSSTASTVNEIGKNAGKKMNEASSVAVNKFNDFVGEVEDFIESTKNLSGEDLQKAKAKLVERIATAKQSAEEIGESISKRAKKTAKVTDEYVHEQPWVAIGAGVAVGLLAGYLLTRE